MPCSVSSCVSGSSVEEGAPDILPVLQALADASRLKIVYLLREREQCVCHLTEALDVKQSTISHHMAVLKRAGLVVDRRDEKDGRWVYFSLSPSAAEIGIQIAGLLAAADADPAPADCTGRWSQGKPSVVFKYPVVGRSARGGALSV